MALSSVLPVWTREWDEEQVQDEFTSAAVLRGALVALRPNVERVFGVTLNIDGGEDTFSQDGQIWLRLRGVGRDVRAAKLFVKGVVNQEAQQEFPFPEALHCVFCGAKGLFMDCLIKNTSAHLVVGSHGCLLITGLAEPVVKAYSFITDLVEKYKSSQGRRSETASESLDSRRHFKCMVESLEDRHTLDLLVLPMIVKEALLDLVKEAGLSGQRGHEALRPESHQMTANEVESEEHKPAERPVYGNTMCTTPHSQSSSLISQSGHHRANGMDDSSTRMTDFGGKFSNGVVPVSVHRNLLENPEEPERSSPQEDESEMPPRETVLSSEGSRDEHLIKFFTAMGFTKEVVQQVLDRSGPKEASQLLDLIEQEQDKTVGQRGNSNTETQTKDHEAVSSGETTSAGELSAKDNDDFVLGVLKKAAATCGYTEERVEQVYSSLHEPNPHELLTKLQRLEIKVTDEIRGGDTKADRWIGANSATTVEKHDTGERKKTTLTVTQPETSKWADVTPQALADSRNQRPLHDNLLSVRGPPQPTYASRTDLETFNVLDVGSNRQPMNSHFRPSDSHPHLSSHKGPKMSSFQHQDMQTKQKPTRAPAESSAVVTGRQRFLESLKTPFKLELSDDPGDDKLRQIIIDGSNVAMSHGLGFFFSCRGIALAVQHFWERGHRKITVFVPQWRQKKDSKHKEQHYMIKLQDLGLLSFTPSREVEGKRINSYDDRFLLNLAQQTNGVIVTNDNLRDLVDESPAWRDIIKRSLLQYLFAGDLFMLPDDPLGRGGPHLNDFLHTKNSSLPAAGSHTFAGVTLSPPSPAAPRPHTEVLQYRDVTPGGHHSRGQRSIRSGEGRGHGEDVRTPEETLQLRQRLAQIFPDQESVIIMTLQSHPSIRDINQLSDFILT
ncbi:NEDD4-binding protein 1 isoform X1 [Paramisgurnus dabryanus]|uniref:NEDD4-binding protein 1 isoform X1 n=1 Tax=Paramisgurnus dabryanus TaxID=90735 RepID=UPI0031F41A81